MARGYLANWLATPPLVFRFQFNPDLLQDKKAWKYEEQPPVQWGFDQIDEASGFGIVPALFRDVKDWGSLLLKTRWLKAKEGQQRTIALDFPLDARVAGVVEGEAITDETANPYGGTIAPDLALLRSFVNPTPDLFTWLDILSGSPIANLLEKPSECTLIYGGMNVDCVMESLNIKIVAFDEEHEPLRAEVSITLKEQTRAFGPIIETATRLGGIIRSYGRPGWGDDYVNVIPGVGAITSLVSIFE
ncbi:MAG: hypothetical protein ACE37K_06195 [Planctomycetota bacterium]